MKEKMLTGLLLCLFSISLNAQNNLELKNQEGKVQANGITIAYESFGSKENETILLISGTNTQLTMWPIEFCYQLVKHGYRVIRFDNRDIGLSEKFDKAGMPDWTAVLKAIREKKEVPLPYTLDDMANDAVGLLDALGIKKAHIVRLSKNYPQRFIIFIAIAYTTK